MKSFTSLTLALGLAATASSAALDQRALFLNTVHLAFHGGPAQYSMAFPADGEKRNTNNGIAVSIIDDNDYNALEQCTFYTASGKLTLVGSITPTGNQQILVGPPQPIIAVKCQGFCVATYSDCYVNGQFVGSCCNGFCAANKCRPWVSPF